MAQLASVPQSKSITLGYSSTANAGWFGDVKFTPVGQDGLPLDLTGFNSATITFIAPVPIAPVSEGSQVLAIRTADDTGITCYLTAANAAAMAANMTSSSTPYTLNVGDGTDTLVAATGTLSLQVRA